MKRVLALVVALSAWAVVPSEAVLLTFEGVGNGAPVDGFYSGSGITFTTNALGVIDSDAGGGGNIANEPSPSTGMYFVSGPVTMDSVMGFKTFSLKYSANQPGGSVSLFDGPNGTGLFLGSITLFTTPSGLGDPNGGAFGTWFFGSITMPFYAHSAVFSGPDNHIVFDNVDVAAVPEPGTLLLLGSGMAGLALKRRRRHS